MNKIASVRTINGKATVTVDTAESHEVINVDNGACLVLVKGEDTPQPAPDGKKRYTLSELLVSYNAMLQRHGFSPVTDETPLLYDYLKKAWDKAETEWNAAESWLFAEKTYPDIYNWHGDNKDYEAEAYNSLHAWLLAMQLSELTPTTGISGNSQTDLFGLAYNIGGDREVPLYGLYIHADPMVSRLAAGGCYVIMRFGYSFSDMDAMRREIGGMTINAKDWNGLGYQGENNVYGGMRNLGYLVNSDLIIPSAPGPYADGCTERMKPYEQGQPKDQFCEVVKEEWDKDNYIVDTQIDDFVVKNFNMGAQTSQSVWDAYPRDVQQRILEAVAAPRATNHFFFGKKLVKFDGVHDGTRLGNYTNYSYYWFSEAAQAGNDVFEIAGPFADLFSKMFTGSGFGTPTSTMNFFDNIMTIADNSRFPTFQDQYGRRRPCGGAAGFEGSSRSPINGDPLNALYNIDISCIFADSQESSDRYAKEGGFVSERPKSYPSGHAAMVTTVALMLGQMTGNESSLQQYMAKAYSVGVNRTVSRFHWNSDVIYGRLFGTMILPIINAMSGIRNGYEQAKAVINSNPSPSEKTPGKVITFTLKVRNNRSTAVTLDDKINFVLANPDPNGFYYGDNNGQPWTGPYNRVAYSPMGTGKMNCITIPANSEKAFTISYSGVTGKVYNNDLTLYGSDVITGLGGRNLVSEAYVNSSQWPASRGKSNILLYVNGESNVVVPGCLDSSIRFEDGKIYTVNIS